MHTVHLASVKGRRYLFLRKKVRYLIFARLLLMLLVEIQHTRLIWGKEHGLNGGCHFDVRVLPGGAEDLIASAALI